MFWLGFGVGTYVVLMVEFIGILVYAVKRGRKK